MAVTSCVTSFSVIVEFMKTVDFFEQKHQQYLTVDKWNQWRYF